MTVGMAVGMAMCRTNVKSSRGASRTARHGEHGGGRERGARRLCALRQSRRRSASSATIKWPSAESFDRLM